MQAIDNEDVLIDGKRKKKAEILSRDLFSGAIMGNLEAASVIAKFAEEYFGPEAEGPSQAVFVVVPDGCSSPPRRPGRRPKKDLLPVSAGSLFRRVAKLQGKLNCARITMWEAYVRQVYRWRTRTNVPRGYFSSFRRHFPATPFLVRR